MIQVKVWSIFYRKLFVPSLLVAAFITVLTSAIDSKSDRGAFFGNVYFLSSIVAQFAYYEMGSRSNEYYFFANFGWSKTFLWLSNIILSVLLILILNML